MINNVPGDATPPTGSGPSQPAPQGTPPSGPAGPSGLPQHVPTGGGGGSGKGMTWLGMYFDPEQTKQLNNIMIQNIGQAIQKYNDKGVKAIKNYQKISEGQDPDE